MVRPAVSWVVGHPNITKLLGMKQMQVAIGQIGQSSVKAHICKKAGRVKQAHMVVGSGSDPQVSRTVSSGMSLPGVYQL